MSSMYAVYHGPEGLKAIARRIHDMTGALANALKNAGFELTQNSFLIRFQ